MRNHYFREDLRKKITESKKNQKPAKEASKKKQQVEAESDEEEEDDDSDGETENFLQSTSSS